MRDGQRVKLNVGASDPRGRYRGPEWVNVDYSRFFRGQRFHRFAIADGTMLPFRDGTFNEVHAIHVLEHVPRHIVRQNGTKVEAHAAFVQEIGRVLTPGGRGYIEVPNFLEVCRKIVECSGMAAEGNAAYQEEIRIRTVGVYGNGRHEGDLHRWGFSPWGLESLFKFAHLQYHRESDMISAHYKQEPVLLYRVWK